MKFSKLFFNLIVATALVFSFQAQAQAQTQPAEEPIMELLNSMADKPEDHKAIADYYRKKAGEAREEASLHEKMKDKYRHSHGQMKGMAAGKSTQKHCERVIKLQQSVAEEYDVLAELHEKSAKQQVMA